jgi:hypothetical protein
VNGTNYTGIDTYSGASYVVSGSSVDPAWVPNSSTSRWITAPGAKTAATGGTTNSGGAYLPGNGDSGKNSGYYVYKLAFTITGAGGNGTNVTSNVSISLTIAADDQYSIYVNPSSAPTVDNTGTVNAGVTASSGAGAGGDTTSTIALQNFGAGAANNAKFAIGLNYLYVVVANTNGQNGSSGSKTLNTSGLLVVSANAYINGNPVPEVGTWLPVVAALGVFGWRRFGRRSKSAA